MRCQHVDDDTQCRFDATRRVLVASGDPPDPDQSGFAGTVYMVQVCKQHDPRRSVPLRVLPVPCRSANVLDASRGTQADPGTAPAESPLSVKRALLR
jgi:hypothetical protein